MAYTEFYCNASTGDNINAGDLSANGIVTSTNGDWGNAAANRFTAASGTPFSGVSVGDFASVYLDGATVAVYIGRVTAVNAGGASLDISSTAKSGTAPATGATGRSCTTGGAWKGPNGTVNFPFGFVQSTMTNSAGNAPRVNFNNNASYEVTSAVAHGNVGPIVFQGYTTTAGDGGRSVLANVTTTASYVLFSVTTGDIFISDMIFDGSVFTTGTSHGVAVSSIENTFLRCVFREFRGSGANVLTGAHLFSECEAYACNKSNTSNNGGFSSSAGANYLRCFSHDNTGSNTAGFAINSFSILINCVADTNGGKGIRVTNSAGVNIFNCDCYNNTSDGIDVLYTAVYPVIIENCNLIKNGGWGINASSGTISQRVGYISNCGFGSGTQANTSGTVSSVLGNLLQFGSINYASDVTPWVDPANGDFRISLTAAKGTGRGTFTQTAASYSGTVAYPDIGAAQHLDSGGGGGNVNLMRGKL